jgi:hypothetical protein
VKLLHLLLELDVFQILSKKNNLPNIILNMIKLFSFDKKNLDILKIITENLNNDIKERKKAKNDKKDMLRGNFGNMLNVSNMMNKFKNLV